MLVSASVINWNNRDTIQLCLESLLAQQGVELDVVVLDNGSTDGSVDIIRRAFPSLRLIENGANLGFAAAHNIGYQQTRGAWHFVLNSDVVLNANYLRELLDAAGDPRVGALAGKLLRFEQRDGENVLDSTGIEMFASRRVWDRGTGQLDNGQFDRIEEVFGCCAAAALYRRDALIQVAPDGKIFAEIFFAYYEDVDLAWRMAAQNWRSLYVPTAVGRHVRGGSTTGSSMTRRLVYRNRYVLLARNDRGRDLLPDLLPVLGIEFVQLARVLRYPGLIREVIALPRLLARALRERRAMHRAGRRFGLGHLKRFLRPGTGLISWVRSANR